MEKAPMEFVPEDAEPTIINPENHIEPEPIIPEIIEPTTIKQEKKAKGLYRKFQEIFGCSVFPLTAKKMEYLARRVKQNSMLRQDILFEQRVKFECKLLLPHPVYSWDDSFIMTVWKNWCCNQGFFQCSSIGDVLKIYSKIVEAEYADQKTRK